MSSQIEIWILLINGFDFYLIWIQKSVDAACDQITSEHLAWMRTPLNTDTASTDRAPEHTAKVMIVVSWGAWEAFQLESTLLGVTTGEFLDASDAILAKPQRDTYILLVSTSDGCPDEAVLVTVFTLIRVYTYS